MSRTVIIDPAHDGRCFLSPVIPEYVEGVRMWLLGEKICKNLISYDVKGILTRADVDCSPNSIERCMSAVKNNADLIVSLHSSGSKIETMKGTKCYYPISCPQMVSFADEIGNAVAKMMDHPFRGSFTRTQPDNCSKDYYDIMRNAKVAGCCKVLIIKHGFHTNLADALWLMDNDNLDELAKVQAKEIALYVHSLPKK